MLINQFLQMDFSSILKAEIASKKSSLGSTRFVKPTKRKASPPEEFEPSKEQKTSHEIPAKVDLPDDEVQKQLRKRGEPVTLFAETPQERFERFQNILNDRATPSQPELKRQSVQREKDELLESIDTSPISPELYEKDPQECERLITVLLKRHLRTWEKSLDSESKTKIDLFTQTKSHLKPFFKQLKNHTLNSDTVSHIVNICVELHKREYLKANEAYLALSIGSAAWPIGVTSVGIHERSGREKISASNISHPLNDETTRKWVQGIKRIMTWCGEEYPPLDASKRGS